MLDPAGVTPRHRLSDSATQPYPTQDELLCLQEWDADSSPQYDRGIAGASPNRSAQKDGPSCKMAP